MIRVGDCVRLKTDLRTVRNYFTNENLLHSVFIVEYISKSSGYNFHIKILHEVEDEPDFFSVNENELIKIDKEIEPEYFL